MTRKVLPVVVTVAVLACWTALAGSDEVCVQAAKRYHAEQIQNADVRLQDADLQRFVQSDVFHRIVTDKKFLRQAWAQQVVRAAAGNLDLERVRHEISDSPTPGQWRVELERVFLELDGVPWECTTRCRS